MGGYVILAVLLGLSVLNTAGLMIVNRTVLPHVTAGVSQVLDRQVSGGRCWGASMAVAVSVSAGVCVFGWCC